MNTKTCKRCNKELEASTDNFYKSKSNKDGLHSYCKDCVKEKSKKWINENYERYYTGIKERDKEYKKDSEWIEYHRQKSKEQRESGYQKEWRNNNKDKLKKYREYRNAHKSHNISDEEWIMCKEYFNNQCAYCGLPIEEHYTTYRGVTKLGDFHKEHVDHNGANDLSNCVPACKSCNTSKHTYELNEWYTSKNYIYDEYRLNKILKWLNCDYIKVIENCSK